jgi:CBS domain containing-hemolysin-like protein
VDEYGGTAGVVTLEDVVEEIVGEVSDEHDIFRTTGREFTDGSWTVPGLWRPDEVRERIGARVPDGPAYETTGGYVMAALGRIPTIGDAVEIPGWRITVLAMDGMRADRLRFQPLEPEQGESERGGAERGGSEQVWSERGGSERLTGNGGAGRADSGGGESR